MAVNFQIEIHTDDVDRLIQRIENLSLAPMLKDMGAYQKESVLLNFEKQGRPDKWAPLSLNYKRWKLAHGYSDKILIRTGRLRSSVNMKVSQNMVRIFSGMKYGVYHQTGTRKMPARPFLVVQKEDINVLKRIAEGFLEKVLRG